MEKLLLHQGKTIRVRVRLLMCAGTKSISCLFSQEQQPKLPVTAMLWQQAFVPETGLT
jgi:hypothetical protein